MANVKDIIKNLLIKNDLYNESIEREFYNATETDLIIYACDSIRKKIKKMSVYADDLENEVNFEEYAKRFCVIENLAYNYQYQAFSVPYDSSRYKFKGFEKVDGGRFMFETATDLYLFLQGLEPYNVKDAEMYLIDYLNHEDFYCHGRDSAGIIKYTKTFTLETKNHDICKLEVLLDNNNDLLSVKILKNDNPIKYVFDDDIREIIKYLKEMNKAKKTKNPIKYLRCLKKMSLNELSNASNISLTLLAYYETGKVKPQKITLGTLIKMHVGLRMGLNNILAAILPPIDIVKVLDNEKD